MNKAQHSTTETVTTKRTVIFHLNKKTTMSIININIIIVVFIINCKFMYNNNN